MKKAAIYGFITAPNGVNSNLLLQNEIITDKIHEYIEHRVTLHRRRYTEMSATA